MDPFEQQVEMMDIVFTRMISECRKKCITTQYQEGELVKGEAVCARRCGAKLLAAVELVSTELANQQQAPK